MYTGSASISGPLSYRFWPLRYAWSGGCGANTSAVEQQNSDTIVLNSSLRCNDFGTYSISVSLLCFAPGTTHPKATDKYEDYDGGNKDKQKCSIHECLQLCPPIAGVPISKY